MQTGSQLHKYIGGAYYNLREVRIGGAFHNNLREVRIGGAPQNNLHTSFRPAGLEHLNNLQATIRLGSGRFLGC